MTVHRCPEYIVDIVRSKDIETAKIGPWLIGHWLKARKDLFEAGDRVYVPDPISGQMMVYTHRGNPEGKR